jgi:hypothetical protein
MLFSNHIDAAPAPAPGWKNYEAPAAAQNTSYGLYCAKSKNILFDAAPAPEHRIKLMVVKYSPLRQSHELQDP